jgi:multidrug transporter EmrE-like cation transporter
MSLNWRTIGFGLGFGAIDSIALPIVKGVSLGWDPAWMVIPAVLYAGSPFLFLTALRQETLTIMNLVWDLTSDLVVTFIGLVIFAETISPTKALGVALSFLGLILMSWESHTVNEFLSHNFTAVKEALTGPSSSQQRGGAYPVTEDDTSETRQGQGLILE